MSGVMRIGTRGSPLARFQAELVRDLLSAIPALDGYEISLEIIKTTGDMVLDRPLAELGGKELFTKEIEQALRDGRVDLAVHSAKDVPTSLPEGLAIHCYLAREDVRDAFISKVAPSIASLPTGARVGTASLRRAAQLRHLRPDVDIVTIRGNVATRLAKLDNGHMDATFLAMAGLVRLGLSDVVTDAVSTEHMLPAIGQAAIAVECRADDRSMIGWLQHIHDQQTGLAVECERAFLAALDGSCRTPVAGLARIIGEELVFLGEAYSLSGNKRFTVSRSGKPEDHVAIGSAAGATLRQEMGADFWG